MRLAKYLAQLGIASRRECETIIGTGRVKVENKTIFDPGLYVDENSIVELDGQPIQYSANSSFSYIMLNKPVGITSTMKSDRQKELTIADLVDYPSRVFPVGRLDRNTAGLILLTDNGDLANRLTHPPTHVQKEYVVKLQRPLSRTDMQKLARGVSIETRAVEVDDVTIVGKNRISIVIHEGRKHIVRRLMGAISHRILDMKRVRIGSLSLGKLALGKWRLLKDDEIKALLRVGYPDA